MLILRTILSDYALYSYFIVNDFALIALL